MTATAAWREIDMAGFRRRTGKVWIRGLRKEPRPMNKQEKLKKISIGVEDFKEIIDKDGYFVDKTLMIKK